MKFLTVMLFIIMGIYFSQFVNAQVNFQGVKAGATQKGFRFECNEQGEPRKAGKFNLTEMEEMKNGKPSGNKRMTACKPGTCDNAPQGNLSVKDRPFLEKKSSYSKRIKADASGKVKCVDPQKTDQEGAKPMNFNPPGSLESLADPDILNKEAEMEMQRASNPNGMSDVPRINLGGTGGTPDIGPTLKRLLGK